MAALSAALDNAVTPQAIYKYEAGKMLPAGNLLADLAKALDVSIDYFYKPPIAPISKIEFRKKSSLSAKDRKSIESSTVELVERFYAIRDMCNEHVVKFNKPSYLVRTRDDVEKVASRLRWDASILEIEEIKNVIQLLENLGILVFEISTVSKFDGLSGIVEQTPIIVLNKSLPSERKRFTALHELGHIYMTFDDQIDKKRKESLCHYFASEMLVPKAWFAHLMDNFRTQPLRFKELVNIQREYGISIDAILYKAMENGIITKFQLKNYFIQKNTRQDFKAYAEESRFPQEHSDRVENMIINALSNNIISEAQASEILGLSGPEISNQFYII